MASVQQVNNEKAAVAEALNEAKSLLEKNDVGQDQPAVSAGVINNRILRPLKLYKTHNFGGEFKCFPPAEIAKDGSGAFVHKGIIMPGGGASKGAIIYESDSPHYGWLLAWDNPDNPNSPVKVYVEDGNISKYENVDWIEIERKLDASSDKSHYSGAYAEIKKCGDKGALIGATFFVYTADIPQPQP